MRTRTALAALILAPALAAVPLTIARANHVRIEGTVESQPLPPAPTVIVPAVPAPASNLQADEIRAHRVRAQVIYANKIEADDVQGIVHQSDGIRVKDAHGDVKAPEVAANVIYADEIKANSVIAENIYVRDLKRR